MAKKKGKSTVLYSIAGFLFVLGALMMYNSYVSGNKGLVSSAIMAMVIGAALIVITRTSVKSKRKRR